MDKTKNKAIDLHNILFAQLERLNDDEYLDLEGNLEKEMKRSKAICAVSHRITELAKLQLEAEKAKEDYEIKDVPRLLC